MSSVSLAIQTPTSFTTSTARQKTMAATAFTAITTIMSTVITSIQSAPVLAPTATTTGHIPEPSMTNNTSSDSSNSSSPAPKPWVSEPYYSGTSFLASVANIFYMVVYTLPLGWQQIMAILFYFQRRREALAKQQEEQEWKEETRYHQIQQTNGINQMAELMGQLVTNQRAEEKARAEAREHQAQQNEEFRKMVALIGSVVLENNGLKEENKVLCQRLERVETDNKALIQRVEGLESRLAGMDQETKAMKQALTEAVTNGTKDGIKDSIPEESQAITEAVQVAVKEAFKNVLEEANPVPTEATKGLIEGMERMTDSMRSVVIAVQGLKRVFRVGLEAVDNQTRALDHKVCWMLDYYLDENERFHTLKVVLQGLFDLVGSTSHTTSTTCYSSLGGDPVKSEITVDKLVWEEY